jgi:hypothetical protein
MRVFSAGLMALIAAGAQILNGGKSFGNGQANSLHTFVSHPVSRMRNLNQRQKRIRNRRTGRR